MQIVCDTKLQDYQPFIGGKYRIPNTHSLSLSVSLSLSLSHTHMHMCDTQTHNEVVNSQYTPRIFYPTLLH